jgi:Lrp/AsnC family transcriptional regulator, regulator for asnA, asnC and gidA
VDEIDLHILRELSQDAQMPFYNIAKAVGVSPRTVELRFRRLMKQRVIIKSTIRIDLSKIGYEGKAFIYVTISQNTDKYGTIEELKQIRDIYLITGITGNYDILALLAVKDITSVMKVMDRIRKLPSVEKADVSFAADTTYPMSKWINKQIPQKKSFP